MRYVRLWVTARRFVNRGSVSRVVGYRAMTDTVLPRGESYGDVYARFRWTVPIAYNIAVDVCDRHAADRSRVALVYEDDAGRVSEHTFAEFRARSNQFARVLAGLGGARGGRVGPVLPPRPAAGGARRGARRTRLAWGWAPCRRSVSTTIFSPSGATATGARRTGRGPAGSSTCCSRAGTTA